MPIPRPQTPEFRAFTANIEYARKMVVAGRALAAFQSPVIDVGDFYRAAWVQAVSAVDHWFHEELYRRVGVLAGRDSGPYPPHLMRFALPLSSVEAVRQGTTTLAEAVTEQVRAVWSYQALQNPKKISEALRLVTDSDVWASAASRLNEWHHGRTRMTAQTLKARYMEIADRRNRIAHQADLLDGNLDQRHAITDADVTDAIDWLDRTALAIARNLEHQADSAP